MGKIETTAKEILVDVCESDEILNSPDMDLFETNFLDSFAMLDIVVEIEEKFNIKVNPRDISKDKLKSINSFTKFLKEYIK